MIEVKIIKIDINTGDTQYETSLYPDSPQTLGVVNPLLIEVYKSSPNIITALFSTIVEPFINVNGVTYYCVRNYDEFVPPVIWTVSYFHIFIRNFLFSHLIYF